MSELDLTEAIEAAEVAIVDGFIWRVDDKTRREIAEAAVRAAAPIIERAAREVQQRDLIGYRVPLAPELGAAGWRIFAPSDVEIIYVDREAK